MFQEILMAQETSIYPTIIEGKNAVATALRNNGTEIDRGRGCHIQLGKFAHFYFTELVSKRKHYIKHVNTPFMTFGKQFREFHSTIGETLDLEVLQLLKDDDIIYFAYPNAIYQIRTEKIREHMRDRINDTDGSKTVSFPICLLERFI
jgi:hypothetical protein